MKNHVTETDIMDNIPSKFILDVISNKDVSAYNAWFISIFDHWLSESEAIKANLTYEEFENSSQLVSFLKIEQSFINSFITLFDKYSLFNIEESVSVRFKRVQDLNVIKDMVKTSLREETFFDLLIYEEKSIISTNFDFTFGLYSIKTDTEEILDIFKKNDLSILR